MFKKNLAMMIMGLFTPNYAHSTPSVDKLNNERIAPMNKTKGQLRAAKPQPSGAAQFKRASKKRKNKLR